MFEDDTNDYVPFSVQSDIIMDVQFATTLADKLPEIPPPLVEVTTMSVTKGTYKSYETQR